VRNLSKRFPGTVALSGVDLAIERGEIHALCGGNGSGKSTLIKILAGIHQGEPGGAVVIEGEAVAAEETTATTAHRAGVRVVHQDLGVFQDLTVAENLCLGRGFELGFGGRIRWRAVKRRAQALIDRFEIPASPATHLSALAPAVQTQIAIARALQDQGEQHSGLLILDEPTTALPRHEVDLLFAALRRYAELGQSIIFISHRLDEVLVLSDRVSVLRDGALVGTWRTSGLSEDSLIQHIVGREIEGVFPPMPPVTDGRAVLEVRGLSVGPLQHVDLTVRRGEVVGVAGLLGSGRSELLRAVFGDLKPRAGTVAIDGNDRPVARPSDAMARGVALIPEDRAAAAAFLNESVTANMTVAVLKSYWRRLLLRGRAMDRDAVDLVEEFGIKVSSVNREIQTLSGGNQQKVILARWLRRKPSLLLLDEPTQGVDVGARADIYQLVRGLVSDGAAALVVASDFEELAHVCDRVVVLRDGVSVDEVAGAELSAQRLSELIYARSGDDISNLN
jgi:ribose transport system ATP-binding protein